MSVYFVYQLVDPTTSLPFYIGKGKNDRAKTHLWGKSKSNNPDKDSRISEIRRQGFEPIIQYLYENLSEKEAYTKEEELIAEHGRIKFDKNGILVNIKKDAKPPSQKGKKRVFTDNHRKNLSESLKGKSKKVPPWNKGLTKDNDARVANLAANRSKVGNNHQTGAKYSQDRIEKIKKKLTGRKMSNDQKLKMSTAKKGKTWEEIYGIEGARLRRENKGKK
jgi:hypothetical protein